MGIHLLNSFLKKKTRSICKEVHLKNFAGKKIVIDTSIYIYRYASQDALYENLLKLCSILKNYNIHALFVFDGKCDCNKYETLERRKKEKIQAYEKYKELLNSDANTKHKEAKLRELKRKSTIINKEILKNVRSLLEFAGMTCMTAHGEADELCAALVKAKKVYACLSEDTDMFAYGTPVIFKYISLVNHTVVMYKMDDILNLLNVNSDDFLEACILAGTDFNKSYGKINEILEIGVESYKEKYNRLYNINVQTEIEKSKQFYNLNINEILQQYSYIIIRNRDIRYMQLKNIVGNKVKYMSSLTKTRRNTVSCVKNNWNKNYRNYRDVKVCS
jgi:hypothetical protein